MKRFLTFLPAILLAACNPLVNNPTSSPNFLQPVTASAPAAIGPSLVIADTGNNRIVGVSNMQGDGWTPLLGYGGNNFNSPEGVFLNGDGSIYVADTLNDRIVQIQDIYGDGWTEIGGQGNGDYEF